MQFSSSATSNINQHRSTDEQDAKQHWGDTLTFIEPHVTACYEELHSTTESTTEDYITTKNNVKPVSYLLCMQVIKPQMILKIKKTHKISPDTNLRRSFEINEKNEVRSGV